MRALIVAPIVIVTGILAVYFLSVDRRDKSRDFAENDQSGDDVGISRLLADARAQQLSQIGDRVRRSFESSSEGEMKDFALMVSGMNQDQISELVHEISDLYREDNEAAQLWLASLCEELGGLGNQPQALEITSSLMTQEGVADSERKLLYDWSEGSWDQISAHFSNLVRVDDFIDHRQASIVVSLALNERDDQQESLVRWIDALDATPEMESLQSVMIKKVIEHADEESNLALAVKLFEDNIENSKSLVNLSLLALKYSPEDPERALNWIASLEFNDDEIRFDAFGNVMQEMVLNDFPGAGELLASDNFLERFYERDGTLARGEDGNFTAKAQVFYDSALESFVTGMMAISPEDVIKVSGAFFSKDLQEKYQGEATELIGEITSS